MKFVSISLISILHENLDLVVHLGFNIPAAKARNKPNYPK